MMAIMRTIYYNQILIAWDFKNISVITLLLLVIHISKSFTTSFSYNHRQHRYFGIIRTTTSTVIHLYQQQQQKKSLFISKKVGYQKHKQKSSYRFFYPDQQKFYYNNNFHLSAYDYEIEILTSSPSDLLVFHNNNATMDDSSLSSNAYRHFVKTIHEIQQQQQQQQQQQLSPNQLLLLSNDNKSKHHIVQLISDDNDNSIYNSDSIHINSLVFEDITLRTNDTNDSQQQQQMQYILVIIRSTDLVNVTALENTIISHDVTKLRLVKSNNVIQYCGFNPGCVPPIGLYPSPTIVVIDQSIMIDEKDDMLLIGGGGILNQSLILTANTIIEHYPNAIVSNISIQQITNNNNPSNDSSIIKQENDNDDNINNNIEQNSDDSNRYNGVNNNIDVDIILRNEISKLRYDKPFFPVSPPPDDIIKMILKRKIIDPNNVKSPLQSQYVSTIARVGNIRRMSKKLIFFDLYPPNDYHQQNNNTLVKNDNDDDNDIVIEYPWRSSIHNGKDMAVQILGGETICQLLGEENGIIALKQLNPGQLIWIHGKTNVNTIDSLQNWISKRTFDIILLSYQIIEPIQIQMKQEIIYPTTISSSMNKNTNGFLMNGSPSYPTTTSTKLNNSNNRKIKQQQRSNTKKLEMESIDPIMFLQLEDVYYPDIPIINIVNNIETIQNFISDIEMLNKQHHHAAAAIDDDDDTSSMKEQILNPSLLIGLDCEWKPRFLIDENDHNQQPVLVLQICIHSLKKVYVFDLQTLLRPFLHPMNPMNELEELVSNAIGTIFTSKIYMKVGYQVGQDLKRVTSSYPHINGFQHINSILEVSILAKKVFRMTKQHKNITNKDSLASLSKLTNNFLGKHLNKEQQCSDWSIRPLTNDQMTYAALDAITTCILSSKMFDVINNTTMVIQVHENNNNNMKKKQRDDDMISIDNLITSCKFTITVDDDISSDNNVIDSTVSQNPTNFENPSSLTINNNNYQVIVHSWIGNDENDDENKIIKKNISELNRIKTNIFSLNGVSTTTSSTKVMSLITPDFETNINLYLGEQIGKTKHQCIEALLYHNDYRQDQMKLFENNNVIKFQQRSGYVEFKDGVVLFVNVPKDDNLSQNQRQRYRNYPNEWLNDGQTLTWFVRRNEWVDGNSILAKKMSSSFIESDNTSDDGKHHSTIYNNVVLFVKQKNGMYICCGRCQVILPNDVDVVDDDDDDDAERNMETSTNDNSGNLMKLHLQLQDWNTLTLKPLFQKMLYSKYSNNINGIEKEYE